MRSSSSWSWSIFSLSDDYKVQEKQEKKQQQAVLMLSVCFYSWFPCCFDSFSSIEGSSTSTSKVLNMQSLVKAEEGETLQPEVCSASIWMIVDRQSPAQKG